MERLSLKGLLFISIFSYLRFARKKKRFSIPNCTRAIVAIELHKTPLAFYAFSPFTGTIGGAPAPLIVPVNTTVLLPSGYDMRYQLARDSTVGDQRWMLSRMLASYRKMK